MSAAGTGEAPGVSPDDGRAKVAVQYLMIPVAVPDGHSLFELVGKFFKGSDGVRIGEVDKIEAGLVAIRVDVGRTMEAVKAAKKSMESNYEGEPWNSFSS